MAPKRIQLKYWALDTRDFIFWFSCAFFAGSFPNLVGALSGVLLFVLAGAAGLIWFTMWKKTRRKEGIGVFVHLPSATDADAGNDFLRKYAAKKMSDSHRGWFRSGPDQQEKPADERVDWTIKTIEHRLVDAGFEIGQDPPLFLYLHSHHEESFVLGQKIFQSWRKAKGFVSPMDASDDGHLLIDFRARVFSSYGGKGAHYEIDLRKILEQKSSHTKMSPESLNYASFDLSKEFETPLPDFQRLAVVLHAFNDGEDWEVFWKSAREAAAGRRGGGYLINPDDHCDNALCFRISINELIKDLEKRRAESIIGEIFRLTEEQSGRLYGRKQVPVRLFIKAPAIVAFAAGASLPPGSRMVPYSPTLAKASSSADDDASHLHQHDLIAIVDGDDVGTETEKNLLSRDLPKAIEYSKHADESIKFLVDEISKVPGVRLLSSGGDSAIFGLNEKSAPAVEETLERIRRQSNFKVSCGYGPDSRAALLALRMAKTSGKNKTVSHLKD